MAASSGGDGIPAGGASATAVKTAVDPGSDQRVGESACAAGPANCPQLQHVAQRDDSLSPAPGSVMPSTAMVRAPAAGLRYSLVEDLESPGRRSGFR